MKKLGVVMLLAVFSSSVLAAEGQVFYRYGANTLHTGRGGQTFTDTQTGKNDGKSGVTIGAGLDLKLMDCPLKEGNKIFGEIFLDYNRFSQKKVTNAIGAVASVSPAKSEVTVSQLGVIVAPKYQFGGLGSVKPWIIPAGLAFMVTSPPSNTTSYLDVGYHAGAGVEYELHKLISLGVDIRHTVGSGEPQYVARYTSYAGYLGINF